MSAGRRRYPLEGLQALFEDRPDVVARGLLARPEATVTVTATWTPRPDLVESADVSQEDYRGADFRHRTTEGDIRHMVREAMIETAPEWEDEIHAFCAGEWEDVPDAMLPSLTALHDRLLRAVRREIPKRAGRKPQVARHRPRVEGPSSVCVTRRADGTLWVEGVQVSAEEADLLLHSPEYLPE